MTKLASKVISLAQSWLGKSSVNGTHSDIITIYNSQKILPRGYAVKLTDQWCATFVSSISIHLGYTDIMPVECGCPQMIEKYKSLGRWQEDESVIPKPGWVIFYDWQDSGIGNNTGVSDHVGIVEKVSGSIITVIEGNYNNIVARRNIQVNGKYIRGYGIPKYDIPAPTISNIGVTVDSEGYTISCNVYSAIGISKVLFPTWSLKAGQDDIVWGYGKIMGNLVTYRVNIKEHNNDFGEYLTHIYAYDIEGNTSCKSVGNITINKEYVKGQRIVLKEDIEAYPTATRAINKDRPTAVYKANEPYYIWKVYSNGALNISKSMDAAGGWINPQEL